MENIKEGIEEALRAQIYNCKNTIKALKQIPEYRQAYALLNSKKRSYNLEEHTIMVCQMFETFFAEYYFYDVFSVAAFRLLLCIHDIGKPYSLLNKQKERQSKYTISLIEKYRFYLPFSEPEYKIATALISDDPLGLYIRGKIEIEDTLKKINDMIPWNELDAEEFLTLLMIYYQVDSGAYTRQGYIGPKENFIEKPKLEAVFAKDNEGGFIYSPGKTRLSFSETVENKIHGLFVELGINDE